MQVFCKLSTVASDVRCEVCGQGFLVYWERSCTSERQQARQMVQASLRAHHKLHGSHTPHPHAGFNLPEWGGQPEMSAAVLLGSRPEFEHSDSSL